jgi:RNA polymerase sigma factor (sigma-70 family)
MDSDAREDDDAALLAAIAGGGPAACGALERLYRRRAPEIRRWLARRLANESDADDLVQQIFMKVFAGAHSFRNESSPRTWLWRIAHNVYIDHFRKFALVPPAEPLELWIERLEDLSGQRDELVECVRQGFANFAAQHPQRGEALRLAAIEGWSTAELAAHLDRPAGATREFVSQCRKVLRDFIAHCRTYIMGDGEEQRG